MQDLDDGGVYPLARLFPGAIGPAGVLESRVKVAELMVGWDKRQPFKEGKLKSSLRSGTFV